jgi:hypothetical protein
MIFFYLNVLGVFSEWCFYERFILMEIVKKNEYMNWCFNCTSIFHT